MKTDAQQKDPLLSRTDGIFSYVKQRASVDHSFEKNYLSDLKKRINQYERYKAILNAIEIFPKAKIDVLFVGARFLDLILRLRAFFKVGVMVQGKKDLLQSIKERIFSISSWRWQAELLKYYIDGQKEHDLLETTLEKIEDCLNRLQPKLIVLWNDSLFLERAVIWVARKMGIPTVTVQHGVFMSSTDTEIFDGHYTDYMLVWGEHFKKMYVAKGIIPENKIAVLGYPYSLSIAPKGARSDSFRICILGQPWEKYNEELREFQFSFIANIVAASQEVGMKLVYRPHPWEDRNYLTKALSALSMIKNKETLEQTISTHDLFFGITSTALVEAGLRKKIAVQVLDSHFAQDDFGALGISYSVANDVREIRSFLRKVQKGFVQPKPVPPEYIFVPSKVEDNFIRAVAQWRIM